MPTPSSHQIKAMVAQFASLTNASERTASRYLKASNYKVNDAVELFYSTHGDNIFESKLDHLFDTLRDERKDEKDKLDLDSTMAYLSNTLHINLENVELFVIMELLQAPSIGEITRQGYIDGWKASGVQASHEHHAKHIRDIMTWLASDLLLFKKIYKYAFVAGREGDQKALSLENALVYWGMLFSAPGLPWTSKTHDWLSLWQGFLGEKWTRSVNRDMWNMTLEFALKSMEDDSLAFWTEDGAWPSVIDDFVAWYRDGVGKAESMEVDGSAE